MSIWKCIEIHAAGAAVERNISSAMKNLMKSSQKLAREGHIVPDRSLIKKQGRYHRY